MNKTDDNCQQPNNQPLVTPANIDARGEQEVHSSADTAARASSQRSLGERYDPELWGYLAASCGALR